MKLFEELNETAKFYSTLSQRNSKRIPKKDHACIVTGGTSPPPRYKPGIFTTTGIANELRKSLPNAPCSTELETVQHSMFLRKVSMAEVLEILISFENKSSSGDDNVNMIIVKKSASVIAPYLELLINCSVAQGMFPSDLKQAKVIPLHKGGSRLDENNYRPISLLKVWSKIFERAMFVRLYQYFENFNLLYEKQYGFRKKHSTIDALVNFSE